MKTLLPGLPVEVRTNFLRRCSFLNVPTPVNGRTACTDDCRYADRDDGTRPQLARSAGLLTPRKR